MNRRVTSKRITGAMDHLRPVEVSPAPATKAPSLPARSQATDPGVLADLASRINVCIAKSDDYLVTVACHLAEAKKHCKAAGIDFKTWCSREIRYSYTEALKLAKDGASDDPAKAIADRRAKNAARNREHRKKNKAVSRDTTLPAKKERPEVTAIAALDRLDPAVKRNLIMEQARACLGEGQRAMIVARAIEDGTVVETEPADRELISELRAAVEREISEIRNEPHFEHYGTIDWVIDLYTQRDGFETLLPILCEMLGLPADPWPGLTAADLQRMIDKRKKDARERGIWPAGDFLTFTDKLRAARHRAWLEHATEN